LYGLLAKMQERAFSKTGWPELCPVKFYIPGGFLVVMPYARPLTFEEWRAFNYRDFVSRGDSEMRLGNHFITWKEARQHREAALFRRCIFEIASVSSKAGSSQSITAESQAAVARKELMPCPVCDDVGWVCEKHRDMP
jgi:hypothetical protein